MPPRDAVPGQRLERHAGAERDTRPAWMTKGMGIGTEMFGETKGDLVKPGMTKAQLEAIEARRGQPLDGPDPMRDVFEEATKPNAAPMPTASKASTAAMQTASKAPGGKKPTPPWRAAAAAPPAAAGEDDDDYDPFAELPSAAVVAQTKAQPAKPPRAPGVMGKAALRAPPPARAMGDADKALAKAPVRRMGDADKLKAAPPKRAMGDADKAKAAAKGKSFSSSKAASFYARQRQGNAMPLSRRLPPPPPPPVNPNAASKPAGLPKAGKAGLQGKAAAGIGSGAKKWLGFAARKPGGLMGKAAAGIPSSGMRRPVVVDPNASPGARVGAKAPARKAPRQNGVEPVAKTAANWLKRGGKSRIDLAAERAEEYLNPAAETEESANKKARVEKAVSFSDEMLKKAPTSIQTCRSLLLFLDKKLETPLAKVPEVAGPSELKLRMEMHADSAGRLEGIKVGGWDSRAKRVLDTAATVTSAAGEELLKAAEKRLEVAAEDIEKQLETKKAEKKLEELTKERREFVRDSVKREFLSWCAKLLRVAEAKLVAESEGKAVPTKSGGMGNLDVLKCLLNGDSK